MKIILAPDSFKGTFSSIDIIKHLQRGISKYFPEAEVIKIPMADGGEGTIEAVFEALRGRIITTEVCGPLGGKTEAKLLIKEDIAVIEMAQAAGITLLKEAERNPLKTTTYGVGEMILKALDYGVKEIIIGIGGSATNDGGIGMAQALGVSFSSISGKEIGFGGSFLKDIKSISIDHMDPRLKDTKFTVICDVTNPLTGATGATYTYGPQKGADQEMLELLEEGMLHYNDTLKEHFGKDMNEVKGAGAAGGLGAGLVAFLNAKLQPGVDTILDLVKFDDIVMDADLIITGEGRFDGQSLYGKVPVGVAKRSLQSKGKTIVLAGSIGDVPEGLERYGIDAVVSTIDKPMALEEVFAKAEVLLTNAIDRMLQLIIIGKSLS